MDAVLKMAEIDLEDRPAPRSTSTATAAAKLVVFANMVEDYPFMAGAIHGGGEGDEVINVGVSRPRRHGCSAAATCPRRPICRRSPKPSRRTAFKHHPRGRADGARGLAAAGRADGHRGPLPGPDPGRRRLGGRRSSRPSALEHLRRPRHHGGPRHAQRRREEGRRHGKLAAWAAFPARSSPCREDAGMIRAVGSRGALTLEKLEAMTCVCSVGLDMIAVPGDTTCGDHCRPSSPTKMAIGVINNKTTAVRVIPAIGKKVGDKLEFGGLFGQRTGAGDQRPRRLHVRPPRRAHPRAAQLAQELGRKAPWPQSSPRSSCCSS